LKTYKKIPVGERYYISEDAEIISRYSNKEKIMKQHVRGHGYSCVSLTVEPYKTVNYNVHILMALTFFGESNGLEVRHLDGNPLNNNKSNLKYGTTSQNQMDRIEHGTSNQGESHGNSILTESEVLEIRSRYVKGKYGFIRLGRDFNVSPATVQDIISRKNWKHI